MAERFEELRLPLVSIDLPEDALLLVICFLSSTPLRTMRLDSPPDNRVPEAVATPRGLRVVIGATSCPLLVPLPPRATERGEIGDLRSKGLLAYLGE